MFEELECSQCSRDLNPFLDLKTKVHFWSIFVCQTISTFWSNIYRPFGPISFVNLDSILFYHNSKILCLKSSSVVNAHVILIHFWNKNKRRDVLFGRYLFVDSYFSILFYRRIENSIIFWIETYRKKANKRRRWIPIGIS